MSDVDREALRQTVESAMSTTEGRWTGNPVDITNALVDFLQWESAKHKARAEAAELSRDIAMSALKDAQAAVARVEALVRPGWRANRGHEYPTVADAYAAGRNDEIDRVRAALRGDDA